MLAPLLVGRWSRIGLALTAGVLAALVHPPFGFLPGLIAYPLLMLLAERSGTVRGAFWVGWLAGFGYFLVGCWWVAEAFLVNPAQAWMAPFAASLLPAGIGLFWGAATALYRRFAPQGLARVLVFAALFALFEWLRGHVLTGFPWNPAGAGWRAGSAASQFASVAGVYGLGLMTVAAAAAFAPLLAPGPRKGRIGVAIAGAVVFASLIVGGTIRLAGAEVQETATLVRIVQPDVDQESKWTPEAYRSIVDRYVNLTARPGEALPDLVVWPEGALPASFGDVFAPGSPDGVAIAGALQPGQTLLAGFARGERGEDGQARYYNSLIALHDEGGEGLRVGAIYDKHRLVPFGEFLPLGGLMSALGVRSLVHMPADFSAGPTPAPIDLPNGSRVQPLICYESLYPGFTPAGRGRPEWIVNVSNDAWFGATSGPLQHLNLASYRAIETGLPVVRATPTGVSAMIDPWGRVIEGQRLNSGESGVIDARLPAATSPTVYGGFGDIPFALLLLIGFLPLAVARLGARRGQT
ncbi:acyltransferase [Brevundimonas sp. AAP58]|uniref:apolipoprotein N-acyltransferase n=1 Tax=Brevundimonas sp. AAP58 TaxID=1523422 RepID=UPI0006B979FD|nr:apolipoprotein N-acyltransferase [Brevundimonas sp. AAP58]KPF84821.1 acyltransferase [Brevundimonas sp. AAP58]